MQRLIDGNISRRPMPLSEPVRMIRQPGNFQRERPSPLPRRNSSNVLAPIPGLFDVTQARDKPDVITYEDGATPVRAVMPCGHAISRGSMRDYLEARLSSYKSDVTCPFCSTNWALRIVRHVTGHADDEWEAIEQRLTLNSKASDPTRRQCPGCQEWLAKRKQPNVLDEMLSCENCSAKRSESRQGGKDGKFYFCCNCHHEALAARMPDRCPKRCTSRDDRLLASCPEVVIGHRKCTSVRRCPYCGLLIQYEGGCKHVTCKRCRCQFCFVCLGHSPPNVEFLPHLAVRCPEAPRQAAKFL